MDGVGIVDEDIARVREATDAAAVIGEQVALRRVGTRLHGLCPFHVEKTPSFTVNPAEGLYYCFGCGARGDVITFVRETQHLDFAGAVEWLAARAGIQLRYDTPTATRDHQRRAVLSDAMTRAVEWYHERLLTAPDAATARRYLRERGYDGDVVRSFKLGWAPHAWDELCRALGTGEDVLRDTGLGMRSRNGNMIDVFRERVMFPIFEVDGKPVAFGGRVLPGGEGPKYKNNQEGPLYSKRRILYGLNWAKGDIVKAGEVIVCEGYTDVIAFHVAGLPRAVATCGTALADEHMQRLKNFARRIVLAYDADSAGQGAAERFYRWEQELDLDIRVINLPAGSDPGSTEAGALRQAVSEARPFLGFRLDRILGTADLSTPEGRGRYAERALDAIASHPSDLVRDQYLMEVAGWARSEDAGSLRRRLEEIRRNGPAPARRGERGDGAPAGRGGGAPARRGERGGGAPARRGAASGAGGEPSDDGAPRPWDEDAPWVDDGAPPPWERGARSAPNGRGPDARSTGAELEALRLAVHRPEQVASLLEDVLFADPVHLGAFRALIDAPTLVEAIETAEPPVAELLHRVAVEEPDPSVEPDDVVAVLARLAAQRAIAAIEVDARVRQTAVDLRWPKERIEALVDPDRRVEAAGQLVAWLSGEGEVR